MKKAIVSLLLLFAVLLALPAHAQTDPYRMAGDALHAIVLRTEEGDIPLGSGVLFMKNNIILTAEACCPDGQLVIIGADGEHAVTRRMDLEGSGAFLLEMDPPSASEPLPLSDYSAYALPQVFGVDGKGQWHDTNLYKVIYTLYRGREALVFAAEEGLMPGALVADEKGALVGVTVAQNAEGVGMYTAVDASALRKLLTGEPAPNQVSNPTLEYTWEDGVLSITWPEDGHTDGLYALLVSAGENLYYTTYKTKGLERRFDLILAPGHTYHLQVKWIENEQAEISADWSNTVAFTAPAETFTDHGFTQECYLAKAPAGTEVSELLDRVTRVTPDQLADADTAWYLQVINRYDVSGEIELPLTVELIAPDKQFFFYDSGYLFSPEYEKNDAFCVSIAELLADCTQFSGSGAFQPGEYTLRYAIGGKAAGECVFTVGEAGDEMQQDPGRSREEKQNAPAVQQEASAGFVTDVTVTHKNGLITLDWANAADLPRGEASYTAFIQYEGNTYYTYHEMVSGAMDTSFFSLPDRWCAVWVVWTKEGSATDYYPQDEAQYTMIDAGLYIPAFQKNGFRNIACSLTNATVEAGVYLPEMPITRQNLNSGGVCFQTHDVYDAGVSSPEHPLLIALYTPEGYVFFQEGYYTFDPSLSGGDIWATDITDILTDYDAMAHGKAWPSGEYRICYYIDGCEAGRIEFTLP